MPVSDAAFPADRLLPRPATAVVAGLAAAALLAGAEATWRARGVAPSVRDSVDLWAFHREGLRDEPAAPGGPAVIVGSSRAQWGLDPATFAARRGGRVPTLLSLVGDDAEAALADLAADPGFRGTVVAGFLEEPPVAPPGSRAADRVAVAGRGLSLPDRLAVRLAGAADGLTIRRRGTDWLAVAKDLLRGRPLPRDSAWRHGFDRHVWAAGEPRRAGPTTADPWRDVPAEGWSRAAWRARAGRQAAAARRIAGRGGRVAFVRFPSDGALRARTDRAFPKSELWDPWAAGFAGDPRIEAVHYRDVPGLRGFRCPDGSHLDLTDRPAFTAALLDELDRRGFSAVPRSRAVSPGGRRRVH